MMAIAHGDDDGDVDGGNVVDGCDDYYHVEWI
jgi:hypothetical protein